MVAREWYQVQHFPKVVAVPITISSMDVFEFLEQILPFNNADRGIDATVTCSGVVLPIGLTRN